MKRLISTVFIVVVVLGLLAACGSNSKSEPKDATPTSSPEASTEVVADTKTEPAVVEPVAIPEGKLTVYIGFQEDHAVAAMKKFTADTGIEVDAIRMSAGEILAKIRAEKSNPQADLWYGGPADTFVAAMGEELLTPYKSPIADKIDARFKDPDGYWTGVYMGAIGFASNKKFLDKIGVETPTKWEDLLNPKLKGEIVMAHPGSSGTAYTALYSTIKVFGGEDAGFDYLTKLHPQIQQYTTSGSAPGRMVGMEEAAVGILFAHDVVKYQQEGYTDLQLTIPSDGTGYEIGSVAIINGSKNVELAKYFIDWAASPAAQEIGQTVGSYQNLTHQDAKDPELAIKLSEVNLVDYNIVEAGSERGRLIDRWNKDVNK
jgi:iron(III) transport system substrate-binding protein